MEWLQLSHSISRYYIFIIIILTFFDLQQQFVKNIMDSREQQIRRHQQKWKKWNKQIKNTNEQLNYIGKPEDNAQNYAIKLIQKLDISNNNKESPAISMKNAKNVQDQFESNICCICLQLMIPPSIPYILFPCGHNVCKICLFQDGDQKKDVYKRRIHNCPLCKVQVKDQSQNRNLMKLICSYSNNKHLLQKQIQQQIQDQSKTDNITKIRIKCEIIEGQRKYLKSQLQKQKKQKKIMDEVIDRLYKERKRNQNQVDTLEQEGRLINKFLNEKRDDIDQVSSKIESIQENKKILMRTLQPLLQHKKKMEMQLAAKLIKNK